MKYVGNSLKKENNFRLSVVIPNYNDSKLIGFCLKSIFTQKIQPYELIIIDDASTDKSLLVIKSLIKNVKNVKLISSKKNYGVIPTINLGLKIAKGDYIFFLSANDFILPDFFSILNQSLRKYPQAGIWSALSYRMDDANIRLQRSPIVSIKEKFFKNLECINLATKFGSWFTPSTIVYKRNFLLEAGFFNMKDKSYTDLLKALEISFKYGAIFVPAPLGVFTSNKQSY